MDLSRLNERIVCQLAAYMNAPTLARARLFPDQPRVNLGPAGVRPLAWMRDHKDATPAKQQRTHVTAEAEAAATGDWTEPGVFAVAPGVHRVPLPLPTDGLRAVNVYVIENGGGLVLIDSGWALAQSRQALSAALAALGCELGDVRHFLVTHLHRDHYTQAVELRRIFGSRVSLGAGESPAIDVLLAGGTGPFGPQVKQLLASGAQVVLKRLAALNMAPPGDPAGWEAPDEWLQPYQQIELATRTLRVVPTPGHTQGHVVFTDTAGGLLFAGDHVLPHITPSIGFEPVSASLPLGDYLASLRLVRSMPDMRLLPAHGPVTASAHARIDRLLGHHRERLDRCAGAVVKGSATAYEVACTLHWTRRERLLAELDPVNQMLAVTETRAHLELLAAQGQLSVSWAQGVARYASGPGGHQGMP
jgi:glyoxylase-like metal-dependent hydrolase (beta-lactamase superfamily II)